MNTDTVVRLVGCGFLGSIFAQNLVRIAHANTREIKLVLYDPDNIEIRNTYTCLYTPGHQGYNKGYVLKHTLESYHIYILSSKTKIDAKNAHKHLNGSTLVVDAVDNVKTRVLLHNWGLQAKVPVLHIGISHGGSGSVEWTADGHAYSLASATAEDPNVDLKDPPCGLVSYVPLGNNVASLGAIAAATFLGMDVLKKYGDKPCVGEMLSFDVSDAMWLQGLRNGSPQKE